MIKAFLFDYDGVMTAGVDDKTPSEKLAKALGVTVEKASEWIMNVWAPYSCGLATEVETWNGIEAQYGQPIGPNQRDIWFKWEELTPLPEMVELIKQVKAAGYKVGIVSNVFKETAEIIRSHGGYEHFDFVVLSYEVGSRKPEAKIYEAALAHLDGIAANEVIFLDDRERGTVGAEQLGIQTIQVTDHAKAIEQVQELIKIAI
jgi:HAD superfamily hydrolase (TIGR01509 family)